MLDSVQYDIRALLIKLADRLHNMRTLSSMPPHKQMKIAGETDYFYAPLANRLGLYGVKVELENLSLRYRCPQEYGEIEEMIRRDKELHEARLTAFTSKIREVLDQNGIRGEVAVEYREPYSLWRKMRKTGVNFNHLPDRHFVEIVFPCENVTQEQLGGASVHGSKSGVCHFTAKTEEEAMAMIKQLISYIPQNNLEKTPRVKCTDPINRMEDFLNEIIPENPNEAYDMYKVIAGIVDNGEFFEVQPNFAKNIIVGFARFNGESVGIVANQPMVMAGVLDSNSSRKGARFVRFCDAFNIPIVTLVDVPGFLPGTQQEYNAVILHGAKLLYAYGECTVPKVTVTLRKSYGGSHIVMSCKQLRGDMNYAWPSAEIAVMGAAGAAAVLYAKEAKALKDEGKEEEARAFIKEKEDEYNKLFANPYNAARYGYIDDVIEPRNTRFRIIRALTQLENKKLHNPAKKHGNIPL